jgi:cell filamentation protein
MMDKAPEPSPSQPGPNEAGEVIIGGAGLPVLPDRDAPAGQRYMMPLDKARAALIESLDAARAEAIARVTTLSDSGAPPREIDRAYHEMAFVRHARGPMFQAMLLTALGHGKIEVVLDPKQSVLERVRQIANGLIIGINHYPRGDIERASLSLQAPRLPEASMMPEQSDQVAKKPQAKR